MELVRNLTPPSELEELTPRALPTSARLGLNKIERHAVERLVSGAPGETAAFVADRAAALADDPDGAVRRRSLSRAVAVQEALLSQLTALVAEKLSVRDEAGAKLLERALNGANSRYVLLMQELRAEATGGRRAIVQVGIAQNVSVHGDR